MSRRESACAVRQVTANTRPSPNATFPAITVDIRVFWPVDADNLQATLKLLEETYLEVRAMIQARENPPLPPSTYVCRVPHCIIPVFFEPGKGWQHLTNPYIDATAMIDHEP